MRQHSSVGVTWSGLPVLKAGDEVAGFIVEGLLASGAFGSVYRARRGRQRFAIKLVPMGPRGDREADALRRVLHTNVVGFHGYGYWPDEEPRFLVLALELVEGRTLDVWAHEENPSALELVRQVLLPLVSMLGEVHAAGVVHRDVKESNVLVRDEDGEPVLVDFGAARYEGAPRLTAVLPPGTPEYRSPEAVRFAREDEGKGPYPAGPADDLWALGVTLYFLLTRELPFGDRQRPDLNRAILQETPTPTHVLNPRVPPVLSALCLYMLEKAPESRYADAEQLAQALEEAAAQADDTWRVPLFPGDKKPQRPAPAPLPAEREHAPSRWWRWSFALVLALALLLREPPGDTPPETSLPHHATPQAFSGQELETAGLTGKVDPGAPPAWSFTPAPIAPAMHSERTLMFKFDFKSRKVRALTAAACVAGSGCVSGPQHRPLPKRECPPYAEEGHKRLGIREGALLKVLMGPMSPQDWLRTIIGPVVVSEGPATAYVIGDWGVLKHQSPVQGELIFGKGRVYGWFTQVRLPGGEIVPICMQLYSNEGYGIKMRPGSTSKKAHIQRNLNLSTESYFHHAESQDD
jgi:serine/threonine-protein kinase